MMMKKFHSPEPIPLSNLANTTPEPVSSSPTTQATVTTTTTSFPGLTCKSSHNVVVDKRQPEELPGTLNGVAPSATTTMANVAANLNVITSTSTTMTNFFKKYTTTSPITATAGMYGGKDTKVVMEPSSGQPSVAMVSTAKKSANEAQHGLEMGNNSNALANNQSNNPTSSSTTGPIKGLMGKPHKAAKSRKVTRAPQPPTSQPVSSTPAAPTTTTAGGKSGRGLTKATHASASAPAVQRPCQTHSFHTDAAEVQHMETVLLKLLDDFNSGKLRAFGQGCSMEQMSSIRDQQESLAKLHFDLGAKQDPSTPLSEEGLRAANENMDKLMGRLERLSVAIGQLNPANSADNSPVHSASDHSSNSDVIQINFDNKKSDNNRSSSKKKKKPDNENGS